MNKNLTSSEWFLAASLLAIMASLAAIAKINSGKAFSQIEAYEANQPKTVMVSVRGAVAKPGPYPMELGSSLIETARKAKPNRFANLQNLALEKTAEGTLVLDIQKLKEIEVLISGSVQNPGPVRLPAGSRLCDLKSKIQCSEQADRAFLKRRRLLKDGEIVEIPQAESNNG